MYNSYGLKLSFRQTSVNLNLAIRWFSLLAILNFELSLWEYLNSCWVDSHYFFCSEGCSFYFSSFRFFRKLSTKKNFSYFSKNKSRKTEKKGVKNIEITFLFFQVMILKRIMNRFRGSHPLNLKSLYDNVFCA